VKRYERLTATIVVAGGVLIMVYAWHSLKLGSIHMPDAGLLPFLCGGALAVLGIIWAVMLQLSREEGQEGSEEKPLWHRPLLSLLLMVVYGWAMETLGYVTSTLLFMVAWEQIIERETWVKTIVIAVLATIAMYALFVLFLKVPIPPELFLR